nr:hypothetical protein [Tanacetum cinerariifolium]
SGRNGGATQLNGPGIEVRRHRAPAGAGHPVLERVGARGGEVNVIEYQVVAGIYVAHILAAAGIGGGFGRHAAVHVGAFGLQSDGAGSGRVGELVHPHVIDVHGGGQLAFVHRLARPVARHG